MVKFYEDDSIYLNSLAKDLDTISDEIRHYAWEIEQDGQFEPHHLEMESLILRLDKVSTLFKQRLKKI